MLAAVRVVITEPLPLTDSGVGLQLQQSDQ
jgi:hypothetical protein